MTDPAALAEAVRAGDRRALARAITLVESTRDRAQAMAVLEALLPFTGGALRLGVSGAPGAGKSTFLNALGVHLVDAGQRVAVLAVDPSSRRTGGSILGDKTRMPDLAARRDAFIRPSPAGATLGGVARRTREALLLCEAAGFDVVCIETVGVGQAEVTVAEMVDTFVLLVAPGGGDDLQGIKRGVMELADVVVVTKADGDLLGPARRAAADLRAALSLLRPRHAGWDPRVVLVSARDGTGLDDVLEAVTAHRAALEAGDGLAALRRAQNRAWLWSEVRDRLEDEVRMLAGADVAAVERRVEAGELSAAAAADLLLARRRSPRPAHPTGT